MNRTIILCCVLVIGAVLFFSGCGGDPGNNTNTQNPSNQPTSQPTKTEDMAKTTAYPLDYCVVTDEKLGAMGEVITKVYDGQEVKFCCKGCIGKFEKDQTTYLAKIKAAKK
ncbi:MAG: hypothetical protein AABZ60_09705 [Planctomycetota bacterium]